MWQNLDGKLSKLVLSKCYLSVVLPAPMAVICTSLQELSNSKCVADIIILILLVTCDIKNDY